MFIKSGSKQGMRPYQEDPLFVYTDKVLLHIPAYRKMTLLFMKTTEDTPEAETQ